jgi:hypothetical protein
MKIEMELTLEEVDKLAEAVDSHQDQGPSGEGWASDALSAVRAKVQDAIDAANAALRQSDKR